MLADVRQDLAGAKGLTKSELVEYMNQSTSGGGQGKGAVTRG
jgi:hypothetical protein